MGVVPPTCACMNDNHVHCEFGGSSADDAIQIEMAEMQQVNTSVCDLLTAWGFQGHFLKAEHKNEEETATESLTVANMK